jgi:hypothetical protein
MFWPVKGVKGAGYPLLCLRLRTLMAPEVATIDAPNASIDD